MTKPIITVDKISKSYQIGRHQERSSSFREAITGLITGPFDRIRSLAAGGSGVANGQEETFWALKDVSFEIQPGEVVGVIGGNGAGKSTLLKVLSRITEPTQGEIRLRGRVASLLEVGTGFHPDLTGMENIYLNGAILGMRNAEIASKFDQIVAFAEIEKFIDTPVKRYSSGMYVRLAFAVAAHLEPEILIVDEVLAVGDVAFQKKCLGRMKQISEGEGRTVLFVSHNMSAIRNLCTRALRMNKGTLEAHATVDEAINRQLEASVRTENSSSCELGPFIVRKVMLNPINTPTIRARAPVIIDVDVEVSVPLTQIGMNVYIESSNGDLLAGISGVDLTTKRVDVAGSMVRFSFNINQLPLLQGTYYLTIEMADQFTWKNWKSNYRWPFTVDQTILYGSRTSDPVIHGQIGLDSTLEITS